MGVTTSAVADLLLAIVLLSCLLAAAVAGAKIRRDLSEAASRRFRERLRAAWDRADERELTALCTQIRTGSIRQQSDFLAECGARRREPSNSPEAGIAMIAAARASGLPAGIHHQLSSRRAVRRGLAVAIGGHVPTALPAADLAPLLADRDPTVRLAAAAALERLATPQAAGSLIDAIDMEVLADPRLVERLGHRWAVPTLLEHLPHAHGRTSRAIIVALGLAADPRALPALIDIVRADVDDELRAPAMRSIARCAAGADAQTVQAAAAAARARLADTHPNVRSAAIDVIAKRHLPGDIPLLADLMADPDWFVRRAAARALLGVGPAGQQALAAIAREGDRFAADRAREELAMAGLLSGPRP